MPTIPTNKMERELRALYLRWLRTLTEANAMDRVDWFEARSTQLISHLGGQVASLGALTGFPVPKKLDLSPHVGTIYSDMKQAAIQAGIAAGLQSTDVARQMFRAGMDKSFHRLNRLARTETVSAYWNNAWNSISDLPALVMVWGAEHGKRTCQWCLERDGLVLDGPEIRDHPNGRCTPIPTLRSQVEYRGSVRSDGEIYYDPRWNQTTKATSVVTKTPGDPMAGMQATPATVAGKKVSRRYVAVAPDGTEFVRNSVQDYSYVNLYFTAEGHWAVSQMTSSLRSAENFADRLTKKGLRNVIVQPTIT